MIAIFFMYNSSKVDLETSARGRMEDTRRGLPDRQAWSIRSLHFLWTVKSCVAALSLIRNKASSLATPTANLMENVKASRWEQLVNIEGVMVDQVEAEYSERGMFTTL